MGHCSISSITPTHTDYNAHTYLNIHSSNNHTCHWRQCGKSINQSINHRLSLLRDEVAPDMKRFGQFVAVAAPSPPAAPVDSSGGATTAATRQTGVFRINCIDCLDRTNVVQVGKQCLHCCESMTGSSRQCHVCVSYNATCICVTIMRYNCVYIWLFSPLPSCVPAAYAGPAWPCCTGVSAPG